MFSILPERQQSYYEVGWVRPSALLETTDGQCVNRCCPLHSRHWWVW